MFSMSKATLLLADDHAVVRAGIRNALDELDEVGLSAKSVTAHRWKQQSINYNPVAC